jgi:hypothetical protein
MYGGEDDKGDHYCKAKGFSLRTKKGKADKEAIAKFEDLVNGRELEITRMARVRENLSHGIVVPWESIIHKKISDNPTEKRCFNKDGTSRPWKVCELQ